VSGFEEQARALVEAGVDALHVETMSDLREARAALGALRRVSGDLPLLVSLAFERKGRGFYTVMGDPLVPSLERLVEDGATAAGANCSIGSADMADLAAAARAEFRGRLVVQPNAGAPRATAEGVVYGQTPEEFAEHLAPVVAAGAAAVGGCCGTTPEFIDALRRRIGGA
jgi:5-methyltetrahydrofolate--homocysteine methyltransferase